MSESTVSARTALVAALLCCLTAVGTGSFAQEEEDSEETEPETIAEVTAGAEHRDGFFDLYWNEESGELHMAIDRFDEDLIYVVSLAAGLGSNDIGLDRGQLGDTRLVRFHRVGSKVLLVQPNLRFRADSDNTAERRAVDEAFAESVLWGFDVAAEDGERVLVDVGDFLLRDAHGVARRLRQTDQGDYELDVSRSAPYLPRTKTFPRNTELEATLTFTGEPKGDWVRSVAPSADSITVRQRHSFVALPDEGYRPRRFDPRSGYIPITWHDYATPISEPLEQRYIVRHRLEKVDPEAATSEAVEPIVYYLDRGAPEPIRSALLDGARWWNQAFEAAGYRDAFRVELLPEGADPLDLRYNVIQWVHRSTRGWSYGGSVVDPRTGEILKGHVTLGSLRVRQDFMIAEGLLSPYEGEGVPSAMEEMALARLRQLSAHEVGHTIGLVHNFAASADDRASVMDYPHPLVELEDGRLSLDDAYDTGIGEWDQRAVLYGYQDFPEGVDESQALDAILQATRDRDLLFISDRDARPPGGAHPIAHLWDNGTDAVEELRRVLEVRHVALERFGETAIPIGAPLATLEDTLVPIYLLHRYQLEAAAKVLGGLGYSYAVRSDEQIPVEPLPASTQRAALATLLETLSPEHLALPPSIRETIPPRPPAYRRDRENFPSRTGVTFDPLSAAEVAADMTLSLLLHPERASRLVDHHARDTSQPSLDSVLDEIVAATWRAPRTEGYDAEVQRVVDVAALRHLIALAASDEALPQARHLALAEVRELSDWLESSLSSPGEVDAERAHQLGGLRRARLFLEHPEIEVEPPTPLRAPAGSPIGGGCR